MRFPRIPEDLTANARAVLIFLQALREGKHGGYGVKHMHISPDGSPAPWQLPVTGSRHPTGALSESQIRAALKKLLALGLIDSSNRLRNVAYWALTSDEIQDAAEQAVRREARKQAMNRAVGYLTAAGIDVTTRGYRIMVDPVDVVRYFERKDK